MTPTKTLAAQIDAVIENDLDFWVESKEREAEQMLLFEEEDVLLNAPINSYCI